VDINLLLLLIINAVIMIILYIHALNVPVNQGTFQNNYLVDVCFEALGKVLLLL
jgi:hypothetical protein